MVFLEHRPHVYYILFFFFLQIYLHSTCKKVTQIAEANTSVKPELQVIMNKVI